jgi:hypothetical protein
VSTGRLVLRAALVAGLLLALPLPARAFCGVFVGKADSKLFNKSSEVAIVRDGQRTVITMSNDYRGELTDFALVVPVPTVLEREQIHIGDRRLLERLDAFSAPRLVEYQDPDPCESRRYQRMAMSKAAPAMADLAGAGAPQSSQAQGVTVEAAYTVGEYDIVLLSATQSGGLAQWLADNGYRMPARTAAAVRPYVEQEMKFFVARVNLKEQKAAGFQELRPLQLAFESPKFMLPIRLGMANSDGAQDLTIFAMTRNGRVESTNYATSKIATDLDLPEFVQGDFGNFYKAAFAAEHQKHDHRALLTEYFWNMGFCDPCAAQPLTTEELRQLGAFWVDQQGYHGGALPVMLTRLHVRYDEQRWPEDLVFQETGDQQNFQARYVLHHPFKGDVSCPAGQQYVKQLEKRRHDEARTLAGLTGWSLAEVERKMGPSPHKLQPEKAWWKKLWDR